MHGIPCCEGQRILDRSQPQPRLGALVPSVVLRYLDPKRTCCTTASETGTYSTDWPRHCFRGRSNFTDWLMMIKKLGRSGTFLQVTWTRLCIDWSGQSECICITAMLRSSWTFVELCVSERESGLRKISSGARMMLPAHFNSSLRKLGSR